MKLIRFGEIDKEKTGIILNDEFGMILPLLEKIIMNNFLSLTGWSACKNLLKQIKKIFPGVPKDTRLGSPIARPSKIICIGLNYADHAKETKASIPVEPIIFFKSTTALYGPNDDVIIPKNSKKRLGSRTGRRYRKKSFLCGRRIWL